MNHVVRQGECLASIAAHSGTTVDALWNHPNNRTLRERRASPHMLAPGDVVRVPDGAAASENVQRAGSHDFSTNVEEVELKMLLLAHVLSEDPVGDDDGHDPEVSAADPEPLANTPYRLEVAGHVVHGQTGGDGCLDETIPARAHSARLVLDPDSEDERAMTLLLGHLDPPDELSGARQRLENLGWTGDDDDATVIAAFQHDQDLEPTAQLDEATQQKLRALSGC